MKRTKANKPGAAPLHVTMTQSEVAERKVEEDADSREKADTAHVRSRVVEYPSIEDQLDMIYKDSVNGTTKWVDEITRIKTKYPKPE